MKQTSTTVKSGLVTSRALVLLGSLYDSPQAVIAEYVENAGDAGADKIWVILEKDQITVIDNGHGMVPDIPPEDKQLLEMYMEDLANPDKWASLEGFDIRREVSPIALQSLGWMVTYAAFSSKIQTEGSSLRGVKGIGALAFRQIGDRAVWYTKPSVELATEFWGENLGTNIPTIRLIPPTTEQLMRQDVSNLIEYPVEKLADPEGNPMKSGTRVEIGQLKEGANIRPAALQDFLSGRFGTDIRAAKFDLEIIDKMSDAGRKSPTGIVLKVLPPTYRGVLLVDKLGYLKNGRSPFEIKIYYDPKGKNLRPKLRRLGSEVAEITDLSELNEYPWNSGILGGYVDYPNLPETEAPWSPDKTRPLPSSVYNQFLRSLQNVAKEIEEKIAEAVEKSNQDKRRRVTAQVERSIVEAMQSLPVFKGLTLLPPKKAKPRTRRGEPATDCRTFVSVVNEHNQPVKGVEIVLTKSGSNESVSRTTGISGQVTFGILKDGRYIIRLGALPPNARPTDEHKSVFNISCNQPKVLIRFRLQTNSPKPEQKKVSGIRIWVHPLDDPNQPYSIERMRMGFVEINSEYPEYREAIDMGDEYKQTLLESLYTAMAVTEYAIQGDTQYLFANAGRLFVATMNNVSRPQEKIRRKIK